MGHKICPLRIHLISIYISLIIDKNSTILIKLYNLPNATLNFKTKQILVHDLTAIILFCKLKYWQLLYIKVQICIFLQLFQCLFFKLYRCCTFFSISVLLDVISDDLQNKHMWLLYSRNIDIDWLLMGMNTCALVYWST